MAKKAKTRETLAELLASCSETLFPDQMGKAAVTVESRGADGDTPLHVMLWREHTYGALTLIEAGADVNAVSDMIETPLHVAVRKGNLEIVAALLKAGANKAAVSEFDETPEALARAAGGEMARLFAIA